MKLAIMQPYLFPYLGYFQLIQSADVFVVHDDVQYIKGGWINRNRILVNDQAKYFTLSVRNDHFALPINRRCFVQDFIPAKQSVLRKIENAYRQTPYFSETISLVQKCFECAETNVSSFLTNALKMVCQHLGISTRFVLSSSLSIAPGLQGQERVIFINKLLKADTYINPIGGAELYSKEAFRRQGLALQFLKSQDILYPQFEEGFIPSLSIIDVLMFNPRVAVCKLLQQFDLL